MSLVVETCGFCSFYFLPQISEVGVKIVLRLTIFLCLITFISATRF